MKAYRQSIRATKVYGVELSPARTRHGIQFTSHEIDALRRVASLLDRARDLATSIIADVYPELDGIELAQIDPDLESLLASPWAGLEEIVGSIVDGKLHVSGGV